MDFEDVIANPAFYILVALSVGATVLGYKMSQNWGGATFPLWQLILIIIVEVVASAFFAARE